MVLTGLTFPGGPNIVQVFRLKRISKDLLHGGMRPGRASLAKRCAQWLAMLETDLAKTLVW
jgi:hypothetical protein